MRTITVDQFEFDDVAAEESLEVSIAGRGDPFATVESFVASCVGGDATRPLPGAVSFDETLGYGLIRGYLRRYATIELPEPCNWPAHILSDEPGEWDVVLVGPTLFIRYHWSSSA